MAKGDLKSSRSVGSGGYGYTYSYNDQGRGRSKSWYEAFEARFASADYKADWLTGKDYGRATLEDEFLYSCVHDMTWRHNIHDWASARFDDPDTNDGRVRRLVIKKCGKADWQKLQARAKEVWERIPKEREANRKAVHDEKGIERAAFDAKEIKRAEEETAEIRKEIQLTVGTIQVDFDMAYAYQEVYQQEQGDWLDNPVEGYVTGYGFGEETRRPMGIKLQVTVSLDLSNSMYYNRISTVAAKAFRDINLALQAMVEQYQGNLFHAAFTFSRDGWEASDRGKRARRVTGSRGLSGYYFQTSDSERSDELKAAIVANNLGLMEEYRHPEYTSFDGEDTWLYPLFQQIEKWENEESDPGAYRLDLIITDAVLDHPSDLRECDKIQARRNGSLQTVMLNFMKESEWSKSDLPLKCVQYPANEENIGGLLRTIINEFVSVYI